jgi:5-methylcytosine-specific restriction endonuclease McrA
MARTLRELPGTDQSPETYFRNNFVAWWPGCRIAPLGDCGKRRQFICSRYALVAGHVSEEITLLTSSVGASEFFAIDVVRGIWEQIQAHPWLGALLAVLVVRACVRAARALIHSVHARDATRTFSRAEKIAILSRAGGRCEQHSWVAGRCGETVGLEADHVHPHSRGGWTALANGQALCRRHNKAKAARVPWGWELDRLNRRRADYFPAGVATRVVRHRPRPTATV